VVAGAGGGVTMRVSTRDTGRLGDWAGYLFLAVLSFGFVYSLLYYPVQAVFIAVSFFLLLLMIAVLGTSLARRSS